MKVSRIGAKEVKTSFGPATNWLEVTHIADGRRVVKFELDKTVLPIKICLIGEQDVRLAFIYEDCSLVNPAFADVYTPVKIVDEEPKETIRIDLTEAEAEVLKCVLGAYTNGNHVDSHPVLSGNTSSKTHSLFWVLGDLQVKSNKFKVLKSDGEPARLNLQLRD